jgi:hypothetical protein
VVHNFLVVALGSNAVRNGLECGPLVLQGGGHSEKHLGTGSPHAPWLFLGTVRVKIGKQLGVSKSLKTRAIVSHDIDQPLQGCERR